MPWAMGRCFPYLSKPAQQISVGNSITRAESLARLSHSLRQELRRLTVTNAPFGKRHWKTLKTRGLRAGLGYWKFVKWKDLTRHWNHRKI